jgi:hypothetical protein
MTATYHQVLNRVGSLEHGHHARRTKLKRKTPRLACAALGKRQNARGVGKVTGRVGMSGVHLGPIRWACGASAAQTVCGNILPHAALCAPPRADLTYEPAVVWDDPTKGVAGNGGKLGFGHRGKDFVTFKLW